VTVGRLGSARGDLQQLGVHEVSTMEVVTFSGVTSGGIVTSGTTCWTCCKRAAKRERRR
jgi:hypothetical protein